MIFDEPTQEYKPRHGSKSKNNEVLQDWCVEVPADAGFLVPDLDPTENQFSKLKQAKRQRVEKNSQKHSRNYKSILAKK
jgi:hypothetical protein